MADVEVKRIEPGGERRRRGGQEPRGGFAAWRRNFGEGARAPLEGWRFMWKHWTLWRFAFIPLILNIIITLTLLVGYGFLGYWLIGRVWNASYFSGFWMSFAAIGVVLMIVVLVLSAAVVTYLLLGSMLTGYFNSILAGKVEVLLGMPESELREVPFRYQVVDAIRDATVIAVTNLFCLLIAFVPLVGPAISMYVNFFVFGYDYLDLPMALRGMRSKEKKAFARKFRAHTLGLGAVVFVCNFVPVLGSVILTTAATGAVLLHRKLLDEAYGGGDVVVKGPPPVEAMG